MYMDDMQIFAKKDKELQTLVQIIRIYSQSVGMILGTEKYAMLIIKGRKIETARGIELWN